MLLLQSSGPKDPEALHRSKPRLSTRDNHDCRSRCSTSRYVLKSMFLYYLSSKVKVYGMVIEVQHCYLIYKGSDWEVQRDFTQGTEVKCKY